MAQLFFLERSRILPDPEPKPYRKIARRESEPSEHEVLEVSDPPFTVVRGKRGLRTDRTPALYRCATVEG